MSDLSSGLASASNTPAPAAPSAAPPASAPASAPATPPSLSDALRQAGYGSEETPELATPETTSGDVPARVEPPPGAPTDPLAEKKGPIPFDVHETSLKNARTKAVEEFQQQHSGALTLAEAIRTDPVRTIVGLVQELQAHPQYGMALRSEAGRLLAAQRKTAAPQPVAEPEPQADLQTADGQLVFSAPQLAKWQQWNNARMKQEWGQEFAPLRQLQERYAEAQKLEQATHEYVQRNTPLTEELQAMPGFADHRKEIAAKQAELFKAQPTADPMRLWFRAYREVVPGKLQQQQTAQLASSALQAAAGRSTNPAAVTSSPPTTPKTLLESFGQFGLTG